MTLVGSLSSPKNDVPIISKYSGNARKNIPYPKKKNICSKAISAVEDSTAGK
jgi:hypothetical protein